MDTGELAPGNHHCYLSKETERKQEKKLAHRLLIFGLYRYYRKQLTTLFKQTEKFETRKKRNVAPA